MNNEEVNRRAMAKAKLLSQREAELAKKYAWKAENIVRFFEKLGMTTKQKEEFLAKELAGAYMLGDMNLERNLGNAETPS